MSQTLHIAPPQAAMPSGGSEAGPQPNRRHVEYNLNAIYEMIQILRKYFYKIIWLCEYFTHTLGIKVRVYA